MGVTKVLPQAVTAVARAVRRLVRPRATRRVPRCVSFDVRSEVDVRNAARDLALASKAEPAAYEAFMRELAQLNTPALFLNVVQRMGPIRVVLDPWEGRSVRFRGASYFVDVGAEAPEGVEAFVRTPLAHVTTLYPTAPDHPLYVVSIENQGALVYTGQFPSYLTHITLAVNGVVIARSERLLYERGTKVYWSGMVA